MTCRVGAIGAVTLALLLCDAGVSLAVVQSENDAPVTALPPSSDLTPEKVSHLKAAIAAHNYVAAEELLLEDIQQDPQSARAARLLAYLGSVYFLNQDYLNAAIAWKKSDAIAPLGSDLQFPLAMAYIRIAHPDWARTILESLSAHDSKSALYPYWLGRIDYDAQHYAEAARRFQQAIALDPAMARAYDNLGLCYFSQNKNELAVTNFNRAIDLDRNAPHPSPWPYLNLAVTLEFLGRTQEAEADLREALRLDPQLAAAHYQLGKVLEHLGRHQAAVLELLEAIRLDDKYAEPHIALAHVYNELGRKDEADREVSVYLRLHANASDPGRAQP